MAEDAGCTWLKHVFDKNVATLSNWQHESLTLSDLKKDELLKFA
jgi:hypothetical protein